MTSLFRFDIEVKIKELGLLPAKTANSANAQSEISNISNFSNSQISLSDNEYFQERAAIKEFDNGQTRVEAELAAIEEVMPYLDKNNVLHIDSRNSPKKYRWWDGGQEIETTLRELGASEETIRRYVLDKTGGIPKPKVTNE